MGIFDIFKSPPKLGGNGTQAYDSAIADYNQTRNFVDPHLRQQVLDSSNTSTLLANFLGVNGSGAQSSAVANYQNSPAFDAQFDAGQKAIDQSAVARGSLNSGATLKDLQSFGQGLYAQDYGNHLNRLGGLASSTAGATGGLLQSSSGLSNLLLGKGKYEDASQKANYENGLAQSSNIMGLAGKAIGFATGGGFGG